MGGNIERLLMGGNFSCSWLFVKKVSIMAMYHCSLNNVNPTKLTLDMIKGKKSLMLLLDESVDSLV